MKFLFFLCLSFFGSQLIGQSHQDQAVFNHKIWKEVSISPQKKTFFDRRDVFLGSKIENKNHISYKDKWERTIKVIPKKSTSVKVVKPIQKERRAPQLTSKKYANKVIIRKNKASYYNSNGRLSRTIKRRRNKVYYHNAKGKLIGYKIYNRDASVTYKDEKGRVTGTSYIDASGRMVYRAKNRRVRTPKVLFDDPFLFSR